jgi:hypothetical protein
MKDPVIEIAISAETPTDPTPITAANVLGILDPVKPRMMNPA